MFHAEKVQMGSSALMSIWVPELRPMVSPCKWRKIWSHFSFFLYRQLSIFCCHKVQLSRQISQWKSSDKKRKWKKKEMKTKRIQTVKQIHIHIYLWGHSFYRPRPFADRFVYVCVFVFIYSFWFSLFNTAN